MATGSEKAAKAICKANIQGTMDTWKEIITIDVQDVPKQQEMTVESVSPQPIVV